MDADEVYFDLGISRQTREIIMRLDRINDTLMRMEQRLGGNIPADQKVMYAGDGWPIIYDTQRKEWVPGTARFSPGFVAPMSAYKFTISET